MIRSLQCKVLALLSHRGNPRRTERSSLLLGYCGEWQVACDSLLNPATHCPVLQGKARL